MAHVLRKNNSIGEELRKYLKQIFGIMTVLMLLGLGFGIQVMIHTEQENKKLFQINDFYTELKEEQNLLYQYTVERDGEDYEEIAYKAEKMQQSLKNIAKFNVSNTFKRDVADLTRISDQYTEQIRKIHSLVENKESVSTVNKAYYTAVDMYKAMNEMFYSLYSQILNFSEKISEQIRAIFICFLVIFFITILLMIRYMILQIQNIQNQITYPIQELAENIQKIDLRHLEQESTLSTLSAASEELQVLISGYDSMLGKIKTQLTELEDYHATRIKLHEQEVLHLQMSNKLKKSQLMNLQMQINPHFLFNTLTMISHTAYLEDDMETVNLLNITSSLLRYTLDYYDKAVPLRKEIEEAGNYVYLQEKRFGNRIRFIFQLDERFHDVLVPNMILQPLLENSIVHGVGMYTEGSVIQIQTEFDEEKEKGYIRIIDNGEGVSEEGEKQIQQKLMENRMQTGKVGLSNVAFRLNLFFEGQSRIYFRSIPKERTEVTMEIPCKRSGEGENV